ncbi:MAG TPA: type IV pilus secretin PilQ family protein, partial [Chromatiaceae bacterium]|nr:type IV pilus secretin PilQ family protein [Chromatiaceae bacterium]
RLSLNFQDIEVRSVLQLIADFTGLNVVVSDSVTGNVTLRLKNVPWDQALDIILNTKGLDKRQKGNVLYIAPAEEIAAREKAVLEAEKEVQELAPLRTEIFALNYADAADIASLLSSQQGSRTGSNSNSLLSSRGSVTVDSRTNNLLVQDTDEKLEEIRELINTLDIAVRQVLIEARIVNASDNFTRDLGVSFSSSDRHLHNGDLSVVTDFAINLPAANPAGTLGLALAKIPLGTALDLELSAAQNESTAEIVASPRIMTTNKNTARIEQGVEIPYQEASSSGATSTSFKKAVLSLEVTPHITRDDRINMELNVKRDSVGQVFNNVPSIDTREVETRVNVDNGQTVVLGGIFEETISNGTTRVPFLSDIPVLGYLFRSQNKRNDRSELLIFVTPKIINGNLTLR